MVMRPAVRDALVLVGVFALLLGGLFAYTGSWPPAVIVESGSMMHADSDVSYGRIGTIDPGDLVLVKAVKDVDDVTTQVEGGRDRYGKAGDVIVYYPANNRERTPIIHRAVAYVEVEGAKGSATYYVRWNADAPCEVPEATKVERNGRSWCRYGPEGIYIPSVPVQGFGSTRANPNPYLPLWTGFMTKGDNPVTNLQTDQQTSLSVDERGTPGPVKFEWIEGKGRAELPWLGLIKLALAQRPNEANPPDAWTYVCIPLISCSDRNNDGFNDGGAYAPKDLWVMLSITLFLLVGVPLIYDGYKGYKNHQASKTLPAAPAGVHAQVTPEGHVRIGWTAVEGPVHAYRVYRGDERITSTQATEVHDRDLAPGSYSYSVSAVNEFGNEGPRSALVTVELPASG